MKEFKHYQYVIVQLFTKRDFTIKFVSDNEITKEVVLDYLKKNHNYNTLLDDFEFINKPETIQI